MEATRPEFQAWLRPNVWRGLEKCLSWASISPISEEKWR